MCALSKSAHTKKSGNLFNNPRINEKVTIKATKMKMLVKILSGIIISPSKKRDEGGPKYTLFQKFPDSVNAVAFTCLHELFSFPNDTCIVNIRSKKFSFGLPLRRFSSGKNAHIY